MPSNNNASDYMLASYMAPAKRSSAIRGGRPRTMSMTTTNTASSATPTAVYLYAGDQIIENVTMSYFYFQDSLGNTSHVTDAVGNLLERYTYSAFGTPTFYNAAGTQIGTSAYGIRHLFQGQLWTQETGLNDYRNRVELPTMGVFLQPDPIGFKGDAANIYRFCGNDPMDRIDPMGLEHASARILPDRQFEIACLMDSGNSFQGSLEEYMKRLQPAGVTMASVASEHEGKKNAPQAEHDFKSWRGAGSEGGHRAYDKVDKSGLGGEKVHEYGGLIIKHKVHGVWMYNYTGVYEGEQGAVKDSTITAKRSNYLPVEDLPVPQGWTKAGWYYAHPMKGDTIPERDKRVAREKGWVAVGFAPPLRGSPINPAIEFFPR